MYATLHGNLIDKSSSAIVIYVHGVGYEVNVSISTLQRLPSIGSKVFLFTYLKITEDSHIIYGFAHASEKLFFQELIKINKVGPRLALAILGVYSCKELLQIVSNKDDKALQKIPGIGKASAERIAIELHNKLDSLQALMVQGTQLMRNLSEAFKLMQASKHSQTNLELVRSSTFKASNEAQLLDTTNVNIVGEQEHNKTNNSKDKVQEQGFSQILFNQNESKTTSNNLSDNLSNSLFIMDVDSEDNEVEESEEGNQIKENVISALVNLGLKDKDAQVLVDKVYQSGMSLEQLIRVALGQYKQNSK